MLRDMASTLNSRGAPELRKLAEMTEMTKTKHSIVFPPFASCIDAVLRIRTGLLEAAALCYNQVSEEDRQEDYIV